MFTLTSDLSIHPAGFCYQVSCSLPVCFCRTVQGWGKQKSVAKHRQSLSCCCSGFWGGGNFLRSWISQCSDL